MVEPVKISVNDLCVQYAGKPSLEHVTLDIEAHKILTVIGPANSGKTTFLKTINRLCDFIPTARITGSVRIDGRDVYRELEPVLVRRRVGIIFALPLPLPMTVFENVVYGLRRQGIRDRSRLEQAAEKALRAAYLWDEIKDRLSEQAMKLSGGQQQRLCIARTLAVNPEVILLDEPCSALDPISTAKIEEALRKLKEHYTVVLVTNNTKQAARVGDYTAFFLMGRLVEKGPTNKIFTSPDDKRTDEYIAGRFG